MKLLIVDDETITRTGLISSIPWKDLGITEILEASDGIDGLQAAKQHMPDIVLSDVRMPRMDGISMLHKIRETMPDTVFIFMSGYSDKEYLKAAIKLNAVSYVEKPLDPAEIEQAVKTAANRSRQVQASRHSENMRLDISASRLAGMLTHPYDSIKHAEDSIAKEVIEKFGSKNVFRASLTVIVQTPETLELPMDFLSSAQMQLRDLLAPMHLNIISTAKRANLFVFHVFREAEFSNRVFSSLQETLKRVFVPAENYHFAIGTPVSSIRKVYDSYSSAAIALQSAFFFPPGTYMVPKKLQNEPLKELPDSIFTDFKEALKRTDRDKTYELCQLIYDSCHENLSMFRHTVWSIYYHIFILISDQRKSLHITGMSELPEPQHIMERVENFFFYHELHQYLLDVLDEFFSSLSYAETDSSPIYLMKSYIHRHYGNPMLSIKEVSEHASLSVSYACTVFKAETGRTMNQYLTEYRLSRACELLNDPRNTVSSVAASVGYNDSNYFGKAFKKYTGISPSSYREKRMR